MTTTRTITAHRHITIDPRGQARIQRTPPVEVTTTSDSPAPVSPPAPLPTPRAANGRPVTWGQLIRHNAEAAANAATCASCDRFAPLACGTPTCGAAPNLTGGATRLMIARGQCPIGRHETGAEL